MGFSRRVCGRAPGAPGARGTRGARAFSLIELLVVVSVIALLIGIVLPILPKARDSARRAACGANLHGVGQGVQLYRDNNQDKFPAARYMPPPWLSGDPDPPLDERLKDYIDKGSQTYRCPGDGVVFDAEYQDASGATQRCGMSYTYVTFLSGQQYEQTFFFRFLRQTPSDTPVAHDYDGNTFETQDGRQVPVEFFHSSRSVLYADSHVDWPGLSKD